jgi:hypothetical protein
MGFYESFLVNAVCKVGFWIPNDRPIYGERIFRNLNSLRELATRPELKRVPCKNPEGVEWLQPKPLIETNVVFKLKST